MAIDLHSLPAFGKCARDEAWARVRRSQATLDVSPLRLGAALAIVVALMSMLLLDAAMLILHRGEVGLWLLPPSAEHVIADIPGLFGPVLLLLPVGFLGQLAMRLVHISLSEEPIVFIDYSGIATLSSQGWQIHLWNEIENMRRWPGFVSMTRTRKGFATAGLATGGGSMRVLIPTIFLDGGEETFIDALASVRPELAREVFGADITEGPGGKTAKA